MLDELQSSTKLQIPVMRPTAARGVRAEVKTELDCMRNVSIAPINIAKYPVSQGTQGKSELMNFCKTFHIVPRKVLRLAISKLAYFLVNCNVFLAKGQPSMWYCILRKSFVGIFLCRNLN